MSKWISVKKYLPPFHDRVLFYVPDVEDIPEIVVGYMEHDGNFYFNEKKDDIDSDTMGHVNFWQPLPPPPEGDE